MTRKTIKLSRETVRVLEDSELERIAGGASAVCNTCTETGSKTCCGTDEGGGTTDPDNKG